MTTLLQLVDQSNKINSAFGLSIDPPKSMPNFLLKEPTKIPDFISKPLEISKPTNDSSIASKLSSDYLNKSPSTTKPSLTATPPISPFNISQAAFIQPPAPVTIKQNSNLLLTSLALPQQTNTIIAPPIPVAVSQPPPLSNSSFPGPPTLTSIPPSTQPATSGSTSNKQPSNPYSARGALNKKVYETQVTSVPVQSVNLPPPIQELKSPPQTGNIYVPPPTTESPIPEEQQITTTFMPPPPPTSFNTQLSYSSPPPLSSPPNTDQSFNMYVRNYNYF
jgi:hypothetical protein